MGDVTRRGGVRNHRLIALLLGSLFVPVLIWWSSVEDLSIYIEYETPDGQLAYVLSKLAGLYAIFLLWLQVVLTLLKRTPLSGSIRFWSLRFHRRLGMATFTLIVLHAALFVTATSQRKAVLAYDVLLPNFDGGFFAFAVALGVLALYGAIIVVIAGYLRASGKSAGKWPHRISIIILSLALAHSLLIGTETRALLMIGAYASMSVTLLFSLAWSLIRSAR